MNAGTWHTRTRPRLKALGLHFGVSLLKAGWLPNMLPYSPLRAGFRIVSRRASSLRHVVYLTSFVLLTLGAWRAIPSVPTHAQPFNGTLIVFAAASLTDAFEDIGAAFEAENPDVNILFNFGSSSTLASQLVQGAPADIFASANNHQMQTAIEGGRIAGTPVIFAQNRLVLIVPADNPAGIESLRDLANPGIQLVVAAPDVPVREYTNTMLDRLAADADYRDMYREAVLDNIVSEEPNVRQVSAKVALGEADAGVVYLSDVTPDIAESVIVLPIPDELNTIATYPIAMTDDTPNPELTQAFIDFLLADSGQDILVEWNFVSVRRSVLAKDIGRAAVRHE